MWHLIQRLFKGRTPAERDDLIVAREALAAGEYQHAAIHLGWALAQTPARHGVVHTAGRLAGEAPDPLALVPREDTMPLGQAALRAHLLADLSLAESRGAEARLNEALLLVRNMLGSEQAMPEYADWAVSWLMRGDAMEQAEPQHVAGIFADYVTRAMAAGDRQTGLRRLVPCALKAAETFPDDPMLAFSLSAILRRAGEYRRAYDVAARAGDRHPDYILASAKAMAAEKMGDLEHAIECFEEARRIDPREESVLMDLGDRRAKLGDFERAREAYRSVLELEPAQVKAEVGLSYVDCLADYGEATLDRLAQVARRDASGYGEGLHGTLTTPYLGYLPEAEEATVNLLRQIGDEREKFTGAGTMKLTISLPEAPSVQLAIAAELRRLDLELELDYRVEGATRPDSRVACGEVAHRLWSADGSPLPARPRPALPPPAPEIAGRVVSLAAAPYNLDLWWHRARRLGPELGPAATSDLLAVMVHPPPGRPEEPAARWIRRIQHAAALVLAHTGGQWRGSARREALRSLIFGPMDWTVEAGLIAAAKLAVEDPNLTGEVLSWLEKRRRALPGDGHVCYRSALLAAALAMLELTEDECRPYLELWKRSSEEE